MAETLASARGASDPHSNAPTRAGFPVVGIGASAGGLEAVKRFLSAVPAQSGLAFVLIQHLDPDHQSLMADLLGKQTDMEVVQAVDGMEVTPDHVYVIPPNAVLTIESGVLYVAPPTARRGMRMPIDSFLRALAMDLAEKAICVILSGTGSDGTLGLREIKGHGGLTVVQEPAEAQYDGMPQSALATGLADYRLPVEEMPEAILRYAQHAYVRADAREASALSASEALSAVVATIRARTAHDFRHYKTGTLGRRIGRRMSLANLDSMAEYLDLLRSSKDEVQKLVRDLLIGVTSFFREAVAFDALAKHVVVPLIGRADPDTPVRVWVPGCASGEEAYSLAMLFHDTIERMNARVSVQVFATDIDTVALDAARAGEYTASAIENLPAGYIERYFEREGERVTVKKSIRESVVFAAQNLILDPPFSRIDLISCRNLLIYLDSEVQARVLRLFHFALREGGFLFLGTSETVGQNGDLFKPVVKRWRIFSRLNNAPGGRGDFYPVIESGGRSARIFSSIGGRTTAARRLGEEVGSWLLAEYAPAAVLVNRSGEALYYHGDTSRYLEMSTGLATHDICTLARDGLRTALRTALQAVDRTGEAADARRVLVREPEQVRRVRIRVWPFDKAEGTSLVCFADEPEEGPASLVAPGEESLVSQLERELKATREDLQTTVEEVETGNEELKAANEEVMSMNEELQSANEELETSKEELQSLNEELTTVNNQLLDKVGELESANNDLANLLTSTEIATIFLDGELRVRRYTPSATRMFALIPGDVGRPIGDVARRFSNGVLRDECARVLADLKSFEEEVCGDDGRWYQLSILPYRTVDNLIDGVVITFSEITRLKQAYAELHARERHLRIVADALPALIAHVDLMHRFQFVNHAYERWFGRDASALVGQTVCEVFGQQSYKSLCPHLEAASRGETIEIASTLMHQKRGEREVSMSWVPEFDTDGRVCGFFSLVQDVTDQKRTERRLMAADVVFRNTTEAAAILDSSGVIVTVNPAFAAVTGHDQRACQDNDWRMVLADPRLDGGAAAVTALAEGLGWRGEAEMRRADGMVFAAWLTIDAIEAEVGEGLQGFVAVFADISTVKEAERRLEFLAHHDPLTGLVNRVMFNERLAHLLERARRKRQHVGVIYLDLDAFKDVNDSFGHEIGDRVLALAAERLKSCVRKEDTLARLGGDEFGVLLEQIEDPWAAAQVAEKFIEVMKSPIDVDGREFVIGVSVGVSLYPSDGEDVGLLIRNADTAMYRAKERGGNVVHFYTPALTLAVRQRVSVESALRMAIEDGELELYYQPIVAAGSQRVIGAEALLRWRTSDRGVMLPEYFLPIAELSGLIVQLGSHVIELALKSLADWREAALPIPRLSINVSARQCADPAFIETLGGALARHRVPPGSIDLEITESSFLDRSTAINILPALAGLGVSLTIDDFGTGYAALASLRHAPINAIKIDRAFVADMSGSKANDSIVRAVIALGKAQGLQVIAEGVETQVQLECLNAMECDACQGFLIAPPMAAETFIEWLLARKAHIEVA
ncbi:MAG: EAL domain-containing protein [Rhodocyclaceae bacterium]|nr:EAL domain-containing protein [Rhodocyclaceae bacterium]